MIMLVVEEKFKERVEVFIEVVTTFNWQPFAPSPTSRSPLM
jgi:hypothetical protein